MNFGWTIDRGTAFALLDTYREAGGTFYQAVHLCPRSPFLPDTFNAPEEWLGEWIRDRSIPRSELVLSTRLVLPGTLDPYSGSLKDVLLRHCEFSLRKMGLTYLDLLVCEWSRELLPAEDLMGAMEGLMRAGYIRRIAFANLPLWRAMEMIAFSRERECILPGAIQTGYSRRLPEDMRSEVEAFCQTTRTGLLVTSALGGIQPGIGKEHGEFGSSRIRSMEVPELASPQIETGGMSMVQRELSWVLASPHVSSVVMSTHSVPQLKELMEVTGVYSGNSSGSRLSGTGILAREAVLI